MSGLKFGYEDPIQVRKESIRLTKDSNPYRILYASDLHFLGTPSEKVADQILNSISLCSPHLILLGGDLIDTPSGCGILARFVKEASTFAPVWAIRGNHDIIMPKDNLRKIIEKAGGNWLEGTTLKIPKSGRILKIDGYLRPTSPLMMSSEFPILCAHNPAVFPQAAKMHYSLVLAGHLHGCQFVFWKKDERLFPGAFFYKWNGLKFKMNETTMLVSRGVSDTVPIRWNCPKEVLLCEIY